MASSAVIELQRNAMNPAYKVSDLLIQAKVIAKKLELNEALEWIEDELTGYRGKDDVPDYRKTQASIKGWNSVQGRWLPVFFQDDDKAGNKMSQVSLNMSIPTLEASGEGKFAMDDSPEFLSMMYKATGTEVRRFLPSTLNTQILSAVRQRVLDWSLELEKLGIAGNDLLFTKQEAKIAHDTQQITNTIIVHGDLSGQVGNLGNVTQTNVTLSKPEEFAVKEFTQLLTENLEGLKLDAPQKAEVQKQIEGINAEITGSKEKPKVKGMLTSIRNVLEQCGGSLLAQGVLYSLGKLPF